MPPKKTLSLPVLRQGSHDASLFTPAPDWQQSLQGSNVRYRVDELLKGGREAVLVHRGQEYRLRITSTGKLILTK
ncbi:MAG: hemin uptake protein HemP [Proteobacteria bacterium]|nr:hemin uptake protein HemP [Pseudomonadota bacterium]